MSLRICCTRALTSTELAAGAALAFPAAGFVGVECAAAAGVDCAAANVGVECAVAVGTAELNAAAAEERARACLEPAFLLFAAAAAGGEDIAVRRPPDLVDRGIAGGAPFSGRVPPELHHWKVSTYALLGACLSLLFLVSSLHHVFASACEKSAAESLSAAAFSTKRPSIGSFPPISLQRACSTSGPCFF